MPITADDLANVIIYVLKIPSIIDTVVSLR